MSFWSSQTIKARGAITRLVDPFDPDHVQQGAYELAMGPQGAISSDGHNRITKLELRQAFCIPRGQFGLLLTEETVSIPHNVVAFISLKTRVKSLGLVNVSGFHVDPGFKCRLKFWVYNAGNEDIQILRGDPTFLIWFSDLDHETEDPYTKNLPGNNEITSDDLRRLHGHLASPAELLKQMESLENKVRLIEWIGGTAVAILIALCIALATPLLDYIIKPVIGRFSNPPATSSSTAPLTPAPTAPALKTSLPASAPTNSVPVPTAAPVSNNPSQASMPKRP
jgi:dCTP deaminase